MTDERIDNIELLSRYKNGEMRAKEFLVQNNMALVKSIAVRFSGRSAVFEDLVGIGTIGLLKAIEGFDENLGFAFSTYAFSLISGEIKRFLRDDGIIKISRKIDTFETSCLPYEDCCTVFTPKHPKTRPTIALCEEAEAALNIDELVKRAIEETKFVFID